VPPRHQEALRQAPAWLPEIAAPLGVAVSGVDGR